MSSGGKLAHSSIFGRKLRLTRYKGKSNVKFLIVRTPLDKNRFSFSFHLKLPQKSTTTGRAWVR
jgi:hypothetical protein